MYLTKAIIMLVTSGLFFWINVMMFINVRDRRDHVLRDVQMAYITLDSITTEGIRINLTLRQNCTCICCLFHMNAPFFLLPFLTEIGKKAFTKSITACYLPEAMGLLLG